MSTPSVTQAIALFHDLATKSGNQPVYQSSPGSFGSSVSRVVVGESELRVVWDGKDECLIVQISHGPSPGSQAGWLRLFDVKCIGGTMPEVASGEITFASSVEYGLQLMSPGA